MLHENVLYQSKIYILEEYIEELSISLLTKQDINDSTIQNLYTLLIDIAKMLEQEKVIPKSLAELLFKFYKLAHSEVEYNQNKYLKVFVGQLQTYIGQIFGEK